LLYECFDGVKSQPFVSSVADGNVTTTKKEL